MKLADKIKLELMRWIRNFPDEIVLPNYYSDYWEMDVFKLNKNGYITEYEIKTTKPDFKKDFEKQQQIGWNWKTYKYTGAKNKHDIIKRGERICNRFFFVVPEGLIQSDVLPEYAGLIFYSEYGFKLVKNARMLHKRKLWDTNKDFWQMLCKKLAYRENHLMWKLMRLREIKQSKGIEI